MDDFGREEGKLRKDAMPYDVIKELEAVLELHHPSSIVESHSDYAGLSKTIPIPRLYALWQGSLWRNRLRENPTSKDAFVRDQEAYGEFLRLPYGRGNFNILAIDDVLLDQFEDHFFETFVATTFRVFDVLSNEIQALYLHGYVPEPSQRFNKRAMLQLQRARDSNGMLTFHLEAQALPLSYNGKKYPLTMLVMDISRKRKDRYDFNHTPQPETEHSPSNLILV